MAGDTPKRILLVEDEALIALDEQQVLQDAGYNVTVAHSGEEAVETAAGTVTFDLVLMDINLGRGIDGTEAALRILESRSVPIVFLSSHTEPEIVAKTEKITSYGYIVKHSGTTVLLASIRMAFQLWDAHQQLEDVSRENARSNSYLRTILDADPVGFIVLDERGYISDANRAYCEFTGFERSELIGRHMSAQDIEEDAAATQEHVREVIEGRSRHFEARHAVKGGGSVPLEITVRTIDTKGGVQLLAFCRDLSEVKDAESAIAVKERLQTNLFEQVPGAIYQFRCFPDGSSCFPMASPNIALVYEVTPEQVVDDATPAFERIHPDDLEGLRQSIIHSGKTLTNWEHEYRVILPSRGERWLRGQAKPQLLEDGSVLWHGYIADITESKAAYLALEEHARRYKAVIEGTNVGTWEWNVQTGETIFNDRWAGMLGYNLEELEPTTIDTWTSFAHPEDLELSAKALEEHFAGRTDFYECTARMRHRNGTWIWVLDRGKVFSRAAEGEPEWVFGTHQDVSEMVAYQERLRRSEANFRAFFDTARDFLWVLDEEFRIIDVNNSVVQRLGYAKDDLVGRNILRLHPEERQEEAAEIITEMFDGKENSCTVPILTKDGRQVPVETTVAKALWSGKDALFGLSRDISDLTLSEEKYATMTNSSPAIIGMNDSETGAFVEVNDTFCDVLGFSREEAIGSTAVELLGLDPVEREGLTEELDEPGRIEGEEAAIFAKDGTPVHILMFARRIRLQERYLDLVTAIDIRDRKLAEAELHRALTEKQTLMEELNHRVKNSLSMVASLIRLKDIDIGDRANLEDLESRVQAVVSLHQELQESVELDRVPLKPYLERVLRTVFQSAPVPVKIEIAANEEDVATGRATTIGLILNELATNAVKHGLPGTGRPHFSVEHLADHTACELIVRNNGNPFPEEISLENPTSLGLRLLSSLVDQIHGEITLERRPETTFIIRYPSPRESAPLTMS